MRLALAILTCGLHGTAWADDIDKAFKAQNGPSQVRTDVDPGVQIQSAQARQKVTERALAIERQRAEQMQGVDADRAGRAANSPAPTGSSQRAEAALGFVCNYKCTNASLLGSDKTAMTVRLTAPSEAAARDEAARHGKASCYEQTRRIYDTGSASCRRQ